MPSSMVPVCMSNMTTPSLRWWMWYEASMLIKHALISSTPGGSGAVSVIFFPIV